VSSPAGWPGHVTKTLAGIDAHGIGPLVVVVLVEVVLDVVVVGPHAGQSSE
jgi:hypothetical protein